MHLLRPETTLELLGSALRRVHDVDPDGGVVGENGPLRPGDAPASITSHDVRSVMRCLLADLDDVVVAHRDHSARLTGAYSHVSRRELLDSMVASVETVSSRADSPVLLQGQPTLENLRLSDGVVCGFAEWSQVRIGDRHWDLAVACRDILDRFGPPALPAFFEAYGFDHVDPLRLDWYSHAVELLLDA